MCTLVNTKGFRAPAVPLATQYAEVAHQMAHQWEQAAFDGDHYRLAWYQKQLRPYGIPLDNRGDSTKTDWELWSAALFDDKEYTDAVVDGIWNWLCQTPDRLPFPDLVFTSEPWMRGFPARTVQGGLFINLLKF